jgi:inorganic pyrophosphatase
VRRKFPRDYKPLLDSGQPVPGEATRSSSATFSKTLYGLDPGPNCPAVVRMIVEIPKNSGNKYEYDPESRTFRLDRPLHSPMHYPAEYGFIPGTIAEDGDPLDVLCLIEHPTFIGCLIEVRPIGVLDLMDQTTIDHKIVAVAVKDPRHARVQTIQDLPPHIIREFEHFFTIYKELENKVVETRGWRTVENAFNLIDTSRRRYQQAIPLLEREGGPNAV